MVEKKLLAVFQKSAEVVENAAPWLRERKFEAEVVDHARPRDEKLAALVVEKKKPLSMPLR